MKIFDMMNVIIPLDFSQTSLNAAHYAANMYKGREDVTLILYHYYTHGEDTEADVVTMGEVHEPHDAENERDAKRANGIEAAEAQPIDDESDGLAGGAHGSCPGAPAGPSPR